MTLTDDTRTSCDDAAALCRAWSGAPARSALRLDGEHDENFLVEERGGRRRILKVMRDASAGTRALVDLEAAILRHLEAKRLAVATPVPVPLPDGDLFLEVRTPGGRDAIAWMLTYIEGSLLDEHAAYDRGLLRSVGAAVAEVDRALLDLDDPRAGRELIWDLAAAGGLLDRVRFVDRRRRPAVARVLERFASGVLPRLRRRPASIIHNDGGNQHNMIVARGPDGAPRVHGIIDFGDAVRTQTVCGLGIAAAYATFGVREPTTAITEVAAGYLDVLPLSPEDAELVPHLAATRLAMTITVAAERAAKRPGDAYAAVSAAPAWQSLERLEAVGVEPICGILIERAGEARR